MKISPSSGDIAVIVVDSQNLIAVLAYSLGFSWASIWNF